MPWPCDGSARLVIPFYILVYISVVGNMEDWQDLYIPLDYGQYPYGHPHPVYLQDDPYGYLSYMSTSRGGPRLLSITRGDHGFGFTLRHFIVYPPELSELLGEHVGEEAASSITSLEPLDTIFVKHVKQGSSAHLAGLKTGDRVVSVNGESVGSCTYQEVVAIIQRSPPTLQLMVVPREEDLLQQVFGDTAHNPESNLDIRIPNPSPLPIHAQMRQQHFFPPASLTDSGLIVSPSHYPPSLSPSAWSSQSSLSSHISAMSTGPHPQPVMMGHPQFQRPQQPPIMPAHPQHPGANPSPSAPQRAGGRKHSLNAGGSGNTQPTVASASRKQSLPVAASDRRQAVHTIQNKLSSVPLHVPSTTGNNSPVPTSTNTSSNEPSNTSVFGVYEPILDRALVRGSVRDSRRLERDPDGRVYEVVQTRVVESKMNAGDTKKTPDQVAPGSHVGRKSSVGGEAEAKRVRVQSLSPPRLRVDQAHLRSASVHTRPDGSKLIRDGPVHGSHQSLKSTKAEAITQSGNKLNRARRSCTEPITWISDYYQDNGKTQEVIERIKKNVERKEEFLRRPNQPIWLPASKAPIIHRDYHVSPQKFPKPLWPPPGAQTPPSPGTITKALSFIVTPKQQEHSHLRRVKSEIEHRSSSQGAKVRGGSIPTDMSSEKSAEDIDGINKENKCSNEETSTNMHRSLVGNSVPKPYPGSGTDSGATGARYGKPFISTLSRIQENIPIPEMGSSSSLSSQGRQGSRKDDSSQSCTPFGTPTGSQTSLNSPSVRSFPLAWVGDNERIKQLQIVSRRAKQFETNISEKEPSGKSAFHRFELSRLSQRSKIPNVAQRKQEFEKDGDQLPSGDVASHSSSMSNASNGPRVSMNRTIPVGGPHIHCEPPKQYRPQSDSEVLERERSNSVCSQVSMSSLWSTQSMDESGHARTKTVARQNSYLSALRSPLPVATPSAAAAGTPTGGEVMGVVTSAATPTVSTTSAPTTTTSTSTTTPTNATAMVSRRGKTAYEDEGERLVRRVSYLKATSGERMYSDSELDSDFDDVTADRSDGVELVRVVGGVVATPSTPAGPLCVADLPSPASLHSAVLRQGTLNVKLTIVDGKKAGDRSWKNVWAVVQGRALIFYKDRQHALQTPLGVEEQISLRGAEVEVASDYTKRRNVLRLATPGGSQLLLQAETPPEMLAWLSTLQDNCAIQEGETGSKTPMNNNVSPQSSNKGMRKLTSLRTRSPTGQSPSTKTRKPSNIESNSSPKSKTWRGHLVRPFMKKMQGGSPAVTPTTPLPEGATIGVCLEDCPQSPENDFVPLLVALCISVIETRGLQTQGIYRIPGNKAAVTHLTEMINKGPKAIDYSDPRWSDVNVISSMLKQFFQKLPDPLFTCELYPHFIEASKIEDPSQRMMELKRIVHELPDHHYETLRFLMMHLSLIVSQSEYNKMDVRNLAIVFGPTLVRSGDDNMVTMVTDMSHQCRIVETLISQAAWFFNEEDGEDSGPPVTDSSDVQSPSGEHLSTHVDHETPSSQSMLLHNINKVEGNLKGDLKKDIVSSIISAANRKVYKVKNKKNLEDKVNDDSKFNSDKEGGFEERDIDKEAELRKNRLLMKQMESMVELPDPKPMSERKISNMSLMSVQSHASGVSSASQNSMVGDRTSGSEHSKSGIAEEEDGRLFCVVKSDGVGASTTSLSSSTSTLTSMPTSQKSSQLAPEPLSLLGDEVAIRSYAGLSASTQERIRRFEMETRAMLHRDLTKHRRETERRDLERKRLEELWQKAKQDMESEDILDQLADNPTEVVRKFSDYSWRMQGLSESVGGERGSLASQGSSSSSQAALISAALSHHPLSNTSLTPTTNVSTQILNGPEMGMARCSSLDSLRDGSQAPPDDGSDLLSAITATFEEKMRSLQESPLGLTTAASVFDDSINSPNHSLEADQPNDQVNRVKTECRLYRDPSLHRRRTNSRNTSATTCTTSTTTNNTVTTTNSKVEDVSLSNKYTEEENKLVSEDSKREAKVKRSDSLTKSEKTENNMKEKTEKRARELKRTDTQESLNEKRPKEMKRSDIPEANGRSRDLPRKSETKENSTGPAKRNSEVRNRKHNVKELKEKFEQNTGPQSNASPMKPSNNNMNNNKVSKSGMRRTGYRGPIKRRHTVGGTKDLAKWAWLQSGEATRNNPRSARLSAWERLQPLVADERLNTDRSLEAWLAHERIRTSSPDLSRPQQLVLPCDVDDKENLHRRLSVQEATLNPLYPVLESHV
ncbi:rho GTPase-activating protein 21 isoform X18 [Macrobrachium rosenbergii]|uniref:rho GTPase-activating protein 21 isoform X18 n=1 Tax=Macrobrachium rosenbergii TaxID=79674 RepID=UPI0034D6ADFA